MPLTTALNALTPAPIARLKIVRPKLSPAQPAKKEPIRITRLASALRVLRDAFPALTSPHVENAPSAMP